MAGSLTQAQVEHFRREGYAFPFDAIPAAEAASYVAKLDSYDAILGEEAQKQLKIKAHVAAPWIVGLARNKNILDAVESLIGPDILLFGTSMFSKKARDVRFVSWHQDAAYYGLDPQQEVTCWVGLTDADTENGCMRVIPGSHLGADAVHDETYDPQNMLGRGQTIRDIDDGKAVYMPVKAGQFSMHHERTIHGSMPNPSDRRRVGISFFYMPAHVRSTIGRRTATLVRGADKYGHWDPEPTPKTDLDPVCMEFLRQSWSRYRDPDMPQAAKLKAS
ncbi:MAG: phytanoyl-CoA dioxygenase family protein [Alphaproteobacteria bacterium]|jgi:non-haem Fe2+, alpha-ketoglutarate-dependent halogenase|nr:MAG: phytanoyl-CoA dioxygenase family protein [Alphaproteobacteria bacterium]